MGAQCIDELDFHPWRPVFKSWCDSGMKMSSYLSALVLDFAPLFKKLQVLPWLAAGRFTKGDLLLLRCLQWWMLCQFCRSLWSGERWNVRINLVLKKRHFLREAGSHWILTTHSFLSLYVSKHNFIQLGEILLSPSPLMQLGIQQQANWCLPWQPLPCWQCWVILKCSVNQWNFLNSGKFWCH